MTTATHWTDVFGNCADALQVLRMYHAHGGKQTLPEWLEEQSRELWEAGGEHVEEDWHELAAQIRRESLHGHYTLEDAANGLAQLIHCPTCGQWEIWSIAEAAEHGLCRTAGEPCPVCGPPTRQAHTMRYMRKPEHDKRIRRGDDYAGDAWLDTETGRIVWAVVGYDRNQTRKAARIMAGYSTATDTEREGV